jgi:hypothetical protein
MEMIADTYRIKTSLFREYCVFEKFNRRILLGARFPA